MQKFVVQLKKHGRGRGLQGRGPGHRLLLGLMLSAGLLGGVAGAQTAGCRNDNLIWYNAKSRVYTYDPATKTNRYIGMKSSETTNDYYGDIGFASDGTLYGVQFVDTDSDALRRYPRVWSINTATGQPTFLGRLDFFFTFNSLTFIAAPNALSGLPDGRMLTGLNGYGGGGVYGQYTNDTNKIYVFDPRNLNPSAPLRPTVWANVPNGLDGRIVKSSGDAVLIGDTVYAAFDSAGKNAYLYAYKVDSNYNPVGAPRIMPLTLNGTNIGQTNGTGGVYGLASLNGKLYTTNSGTNPVYTVNTSTGALTPDGGSYLSGGVNTGNPSDYVYGMTSRAEPFGGSCNVTDIQITKTTMDADKTINVGENVDFKLTVSHAQGSTAKAETVTVSDTLPSGLDFVSARVSYDGGASFTAVTPNTNTKNADGTTSLAFPSPGRMDVSGAIYNAAGAQLGAGPLQYLVTVKANSSAPINTNLTNVAKVATPTTETTLANNTASDVVKVLAPTAPPAVCTNMYSMVVTAADYDYYGNPVYFYGGKIQRLDETTNTLVGTSLALPNGVTSASLAISPDGTKFYAGGDNGYLYIYDTAAGRWVIGSAFSNRTSRIVRMASTPSGTGYAMDSDGNFWSFTPTGTTTSLGKLSSNSTSSLNFYENGDMFATADGKLYLLSADTGGAVTLWYVNPTTMKAEYLGKMFDTSAYNRQYNGLASTPNGTFASSSAGYLIKVDPVTLQNRLVSNSSDGQGSTDLASCYYPSYAPVVNSVKSVQKVAGSAGTEVRAGDTLEYTVVVRNSGNLPAGGTLFRDPLPAGTTYVPGSATVNGFSTTVLNGTTVNLGGASYPFATSVGICSTSTTACTDQVLKADTTPDTIDNEAVVKFRVTVNPGVTSVTNTAITSFNDGGNPPTDTPSNTTTTPVVTPPQLTIAKTSNAQNGTWAVGQTGASYTLTVRNASTVSTAGTITVKDLLPTGLTYNGAATAPSGWTCSVSGQVLTCTTSNVLAAGASVDVTVPVNVVSTGTLTNKAVVGGGGDPDPIPDPATCTPGSTNPQNQCAAVPVTVAGQPALGVIKTVRKVEGSDAGGSSAAVSPGDVLEYTITVRNTGSAAATGVTFQDALPAGTTYVADSARINGAAITTTGGASTSLSGAAYPFASPVGICSFGTGASACTTQTVNVDTTPATTDNEAVVTFRVKVNTPFTLSPSQVSNQAFVTVPGRPPVPSDDPTTPEPNDPTVVPVIKPVKLVPVKTVQNVTAGTPPSTSTQGNPGDTLEYCIVTTNTGSANATRITFGDNVPLNTNFLVGGYGPGRDIQWKTSTGLANYYTATVDTDLGALVGGRVTVTDPNFVLQPTQSFTVCFRATIK